ncbi:hypothetical protein AQUCO_04900191v1 [Aquilegia coerulea]|uniref:N-acetyltransferase domain-containing protein n=1 Tax=Aquilegia coerulea TaxID=218851 RepID=A0A2G5CK85_AQUCA|nr:hypothetical protein AQUCO_04900191v1 [Aquilegia coerulea]
MAISLSRITLRPFKLSDVDDFMLWATDDRVIKFIRLSKFTSREEALTYLKEVAIPHPWHRTVCLDDRSIGFVSIFPGSGDYICRGDIGYALAAEYWGQGIGTVAVKLALASVLCSFPHMERLQALVDVDNQAWQRVLEKAGFLKEGILRKNIVFKGKTIDNVCYSFLSTDIVPM